MTSGASSRFSLRGARWVACSATVLLGGLGCSGGSEVGFQIDVLRPGSGTVQVEMRVSGVGRNEPLSLSSFIQPEALRLDSIEAHRGNQELKVESSRDEGGFARFVVSPSSGGSDVIVRYRVRPGFAEEAKMTGPTGYRFGWLDSLGGLFAARQIFLLPTRHGSRARITAAFHLPATWTLAAPWDPPGADGRIVFQGRDAISNLIQATVGIGHFDTVSAESFRAYASKRLPDSDRREALRSARALESHLARIVGRPRTPFALIMDAPAPDGMLISIVPGPTSLGVSMGAGRPTRWLSIGRVMGRAYLESRGVIGSPSSHWLAEGLPAWLTAGFSESQGWRTRQEWLERFYYDAAALRIDLRHPADLTDASDALLREWRAALVLARLDDALRRRGAFSLEERLRHMRGALDAGRLLKGLPAPPASTLAEWLEARPFAFPFPGADSAGPPVELRAPPALSATSSGRRLDLVLAARNLGLLEQCGCRGQQAGGLARRATLLRQRPSRGVPSLAIEVGDAMPFDQEAFVLDEQKRIESDLVLELLARSGVAASVVSHAELSYGPGFLEQRAEHMPRGFSLLSANVDVPRLAASLDRRVGNTQVRVIGVADPSSYHLGRALEFEDAIAPIRVTPATDAVRGALARATPGSLTVVAGALAPATVLEIARLDPGPSLIVTSDYFHFHQDPRIAFERPLESLTTLGQIGRTLVVLLRTDSYALARLGLRVDASGNVTAAEIEELLLDDSVPEDAGVRSRLDAHYAMLARASRLPEPVPIGSRLQQRLAASYVGATACEPCHAGPSRQWAVTPHATAFSTLLSRRRQGVPGCFACHVTGFRQASGYRVLSDRKLRDVQCESCHGPGSEHVRAPAASNIVRDPPRDACFECHDPEHSEMTSATFDDYRRRVVHDGVNAEGASASTGDRLPVGGGP